MNKIQEVERKIKINSGKIEKLFKENSKLESKKQLLAMELAKKSNLLNELNWEIRLWRDDITIIGKYNGKQRPKVFDVLKDKYGQYHYEIEMLDGISMRFDDEEISVGFKDIGNLNKFIVDWGIKINLESFKKEMLEYSNKLDEMNNIVENLSGNSDYIVIQKISKSES